MLHMIPLTFQLLLGAVQSLPIETTTQYCPWPPCYQDSWDLDYAQIPILASTKEPISYNVTSQEENDIDFNPLYSGKFP